MELFHANKQWSTRPPDERFPSLQSLYSTCKGYADIAVEREDVPYSTLRTEAIDGDVVLVGKGNVPSSLTNWSFGQLCSRVGAPAGFIRELPATLACQVVNNRLKDKYPAVSACQPSDDKASLLFHKNGSIVCRSITSDKYSRIWNHEVAERLMDLETRGWSPATPTFRQFGDNAPSLYASDHDMFAMMMMPNTFIQQPVRTAKDQAPLYRGLIYSNSEVGAGSLTAMSFFFNQMCGNHIIWGASQVIELNLRHVGSIRERMQHWDVAIRKYADSSMQDDAQRLATAVNTRIAGTKEDLLDVLFGKRLSLSRKAIEASYDAALPEQDGDPLTVWGFVQGATRYSQTLKYTDDRVRVDKAAAKVLSMAF